MTLSPAVRLLVVLDCDSTTIEDEVIELLADAAGTRESVAEITERAMLGELDFSDSLTERVATLAGTPESVFAQAYQRVTVSRGMRELVTWVHDRGGVVGIVSGGFHEVLDLIANDLGVDRWRANRLVVADGVLTGELTGPVIDAQAKATALREWAAEFDIPLEHTVAIGDGANDLTMMEVAALSIGYNAKPIVRERADHSIEANLALAIPLIEALDL